MTKHRTNRILIGAAAAIGVLAGAAGIASAVTTDSGSGSTPTSVERVRDDDGGDDVGDRDDRDDDGGRDDEISDPALVEAAAVTQAEAEGIAVAEVPGTVRDIHIETEDGRAEWDVEVDGDDGSRHDLQVDAATGQIVEHDVDDD